MKTLLLAFLFLTFLVVAWSSELLYYQDFSSGVFPAGWTTQGPGNWSVTQSGNAFDDPPELTLVPASGTGPYYCISQAFDTHDYNECSIFFWYTVAGNPANYTPFQVSLQVTTDMVNWTPLWTMTTDAGIYQAPVFVTIPGTYLNTSGFHFAFVYNGNYTQILAWCIDNIILNITSKNVYGTWTAANSPYYMHTDCIVPEYSELVIEPGVHVIADTYCGLTVYGSIVLQGAPGDSIYFTCDDEWNGWKGITIDSDLMYEMSITYCVFENCRKPETDYGGALKLLTGEWVNIGFCRFSSNRAGDAGALYIDNAFHTSIYNCLFEDNYSYGAASALSWSGYEEINLSFCAFRNNSFENGTNLGHAVFYAEQMNTHLDIYANTFAHNYGGIASCYLQGNESQDADFFVNFNSCIFWNPYVPYEAAFVEAFPIGHIPTFYYCDIDDQKVSGATPYFTGCIDADPMFKGYEDCHLLGSSPCINTGQPGAVDPDGSRKDMGAFAIYNKAVIQTVNDVPFDQGRRVEVFWKRSEMDNTWMQGSFYSVWRGDTFRGQTGTFINSPAELSTLEDLSSVFWLERDIAWVYLGQLPAYNFAYYAFEAPTQQDSSATGTHAVPFRVAYQWANGFSTSAEMSGYSVDNIPPDPVRDLVISKDNGDMRLDWSDVTTGTCNGTSFPELNGVFYKIYCSDDPYFEIGPATYLTTTTETFSLLDYLTEDRKFFRIIVSDQ